MFQRARDERQKGAPGGMRPPGAAFEVHRDPRPFERVLEQPGVVPGRTNRDRHPVERHAAPRLTQHAARDLDRFASFARRREQLDRIARIAAWRRRGGKQVVADAVEP